MNPQEQKRRGLAFTIVAVVLAIFTAVLFLIFVVALEKRYDPMQVVVAAQEIAPGTLITPEMVTTDTVPVKSYRFTYFQSVEELAGRRISLIWYNKGDILSRNGVAEGWKLEPGMRAVTVPADQVATVASGIRPGSRVDIIASYIEDRGQQQQAQAGGGPAIPGTTGSVVSGKTTLLIQNVEVLDVYVPSEQLLQAPPAGGAVPTPGPTPTAEMALQVAGVTRRVVAGITLALRVEDAMRLSWMVNFGQEVRLLLRPINDPNPIRVAPVTIDSFK